jgi:hypothetical protein
MSSRLLGFLRWECLLSQALDRRGDRLSSSLKPDQCGGKLALYGGGTLGQDVSLPRLREWWPPDSIRASGEASTEWQATFRGQPPVCPGVDTRAFGGKAPQAAADRFEAFNERR